MIPKWVLVFLAASLILAAVPGVNGQLSESQRAYINALGNQTIANVGNITNLQEQYNNLKDRFFGGGSDKVTINIENSTDVNLDVGPDNGQDVNIKYSKRVNSRIGANSTSDSQHIGDNDATVGGMHIGDWDGNPAPKTKAASVSTQTSAIPVSYDQIPEAMKNNPSTYVDGVKRNLSDKGWSDVTGYYTEGGRKFHPHQDGTIHGRITRNAQTGEDTFSPTAAT